MERREIIKQLQLECKLLGNDEITPLRIKEILDENKLILDYSLGGKVFGVIPKTILRLDIHKVSISYLRDLEIPEGIYLLKNMKSLSINSSNIYISDKIALLKNLEELFIDNTRIKHLEYLPKSVGKTTSLNNLQLTNNNLSFLPDSIGVLSNLVELDLSGNRLQELPDGIGGLNSLKELNLLNNQLSHLPDSICSLPKLETLQLNNNNLSVLPVCFDELYQRLVHFSAKNNEVNLSYPTKRCKSHCGW